MAFVIAEPCIDVLDQTCVSVCPVDCIHFGPEVDRKVHIDADDCIDCGACEAECPGNAIFPADCMPPQWAGYIESNALWFKDRGAARQMLDAIFPALGAAR